MHEVTDSSHDLRSAIEASGYYPDVVADAPDRGPGLDGAQEADPAPVHAFAVFDHHRGVRSVGHRRPGHHPNGLPGAERAGERRRSGRDLADHLELGRDLGHDGGPHRVAVDGGVGERRHVLGRHDVLGQDASEGIRERDGLSGQGSVRHGRPEALDRLLTTDDGEELFLAGGLGQTVEEGALVRGDGGGHGGAQRGRPATMLPAGYPSESGPTRIAASAWIRLVSAKSLLPRGSRPSGILRA